MPYKLSKTKKSVMVKKGGKWITLKTYKSEAEARKYLSALNINVRHK